MFYEVWGIYDTTGIGMVFLTLAEWNWKQLVSIFDFEIDIEIVSTENFSISLFECFNIS